jgi:outer membrane biosynthesis protein TonB
MPARGLHGLWLRGLAAAAASLVALASSGALVTAAVVGPAQQGPAVVLTDDGQWPGSGTGDLKPAPDKPGPPTVDRAKLAPTKHKHIAPTPKPTPPAKPAPHPKTPIKGAAAPHQAAHPPAHAAAPAAPAPAATVVVDSTDPALFSAQAVAATDATRVLPIERLGPLSGISFGSGLFVWPLLLAVDVLALAVIARMALRRRLASPED